MRLVLAVVGIAMLLNILRRGNLRERWSRLNGWWKAAWVCGLVGAFALLSLGVMVVNELSIAAGLVGSILLHFGYGSLGCGAVCAFMAGLQEARSSR